MTTATTIRMDDKLKSQAVGILDSIGLGLNAYINLAIRQLVNQRRIPFDLVAADEIPNDETYRAMLVAEAKAAGIIPSNDPVFADPDSLMASLEQ